MYWSKNGKCTDGLGAEQGEREVGGWKAVRCGNTWRKAHQVHFLNPKEDKCDFLLVIV